MAWGLSASKALSEMQGMFGPIRWCVWSFRPSSPLRLPHLKFFFFSAATVARAIVHRHRPFHDLCSFLYAEVCIHSQQSTVSGHHSTLWLLVAGNSQPLEGSLWRAAWLSVGKLTFPSLLSVASLIRKTWPSGSRRVTRRYPFSSHCGWRSNTIWLNVRAWACEPMGEGNSSKDV